MTAGFTGTRSGMSKKQAEEVIEFLRLHDGIEVIRHGMCIGADADFHTICRVIIPDVQIIGHPGKGVNEKGRERPFRAKVIPDQLVTETTHFARNRDIVDGCDILLACPYNMNGQGGTWYTINYAKKIKKSYKIFLR